MLSRKQCAGDPERQILLMIWKGKVLFLFFFSLMKKTVWPPSLWKQHILRFESFFFSPFLFGFEFWLNSDHSLQNTILHSNYNQSGVICLNVTKTHKGPDPGGPEQVHLQQWSALAVSCSCGASYPNTAVTASCLHAIRPRRRPRN